MLQILHTQIIRPYLTNIPRPMHSGTAFTAGNAATLPVDPSANNITHRAKFFSL